jgi:hypothetical protein
MLLFDILEIYLQLHTPNWSNILQLISQVKSFFNSLGFSQVKVSFYVSVSLPLIWSYPKWDGLDIFAFSTSHSINSRSIHLNNKMCVENVCSELDFDLGLSVQPWQHKQSIRVLEWCMKKPCGLVADEQIHPKSLAFCNFFNFIKNTCLHQQYKPSIFTLITQLERVYVLLEVRLIHS